MWPHRSTCGGQSRLKAARRVLADFEEHGAELFFDYNHAALYGFTKASGEAAAWFTPEVRNGELWASTDDGLVHVSRDGGAKWENVTKNIPGMPEWATIKCIEPSSFDSAVAYPGTEAVWRSVIAELDAPVGRIFITHYHPDHAGCADWLSQGHGAPVWMSSAEYFLGHALLTESAGLPAKCTRKL